MPDQRIATFFISVNHAKPFSVGTNWAFSVAQIKHSGESMVMVINVYKDPVRMVDAVSALALRQVGYAIPTDLFGPFYVSLRGGRSRSHYGRKCQRWVPVVTRYDI